LTNLAEVYAQTGRAQLARVTLRRALAINPKQEAARRLLAQLIEK
jgi:Tfp pilus assembly protein PilF